MTKAYWVAHVDVTEPEGYKAYMGADMAAFRKYGGRFLVRGGQFELLEGASRSRTVVIEFPDYQSAVACYHSPELSGRRRPAQRASGVRPHRHRGLRRPAALSRPLAA